MKTLFKWILKAAVALVLLLAIAITALVVIVDPNDYKTDIEALAAKQNIELTINGKLGWQFFPGLGITISDTQVRGKQLPDIAFQEARLALNLKALIGGQLDINSVVIESPLIRIEQTNPNAGQQAAAVAASPIAAATAADTTNDQPLALNIEQLTVNNGTVELLNNGVVSQRIEQLQLRGEQLNLQQAFPVSLAFTTALPDVAERLSLSLTTNTQLAQELKQLSLRDINAQLDLQSERLGNHQLTLATDLLIDLTSDQLQLPAATLTLDGIPMQLAATVNQLTNTPDVSANIEIAPFAPQSLLAGFGVDDLPINNLALNGQLQFADSNFQLSDLKLTMDQFTLTGQLKANTSNVNARLNGSTLNLDQYAAKGNSSDDTANNNALFAPLLAPLALLDGRRGNVDIGLQQLITNGNQFNDLQLRATSNGDAIAIKKLSANGFGGSVTADGHIGLNTTEPTLRFNATASDVNLQTALSQLADYGDLKGRGTLSVSGNSRGNSTEALQQNLKASGKFQAPALELNGTNLEQSLCDVVATIERQPAKTDWPPLTQLGSTDATFSLAGDQFTLDSLNSRLGNVHISGRGNADLNTKRYQALIAANLKAGSTSDNGCTIKSKSIRNRDIPVQCQGSFDGDPKCRPDQTFVQQIVAEKLSKKLSEKLFGKPENNATENGTSEDGDNSEQPQDPLKSLLEGLLKKRNK